jgi:hypothetical protein
MAAKSSVMEDMIRTRELRELLDLQEKNEREYECNLVDQFDYSWLGLIGITDYLHSEDEPKRRFERNYQAWVDLQNFIAELRAIKPSIDFSFFYRFKQLVGIYTTIRYPNFVAVIQPKLHLINTIEA